LSLLRPLAAWCAGIFNPFTLPAQLAHARPCLPRLIAQPSSNDSRYAFMVEWYDPTASLIRQYQLIYYASDGTLEMVRTAERPW